MFQRVLPGLYNITPKGSIRKEFFMSTGLKFVKLNNLLENKKIFIGTLASIRLVAYPETNPRIPETCFQCNA